jgi:hypothetical protein
MVAAALTAGCAAPTVALPDADPSGAPTTVERTTTSTSASTTTTAPPPPDTTAPGSVEPGTTVVAPDVVLPVDQLGPATDAIAGVRGGSPRYHRIDLNPEGIGLFVDQGGQAVPYLWLGDGLRGPGEPAPPDGGGATFPARGAAFDRVPSLVAQTEQFTGGQVVQVTGVAAPGVGVLWVMNGVRSDGSPIAALWGADGSLRGLQG